jgi:hypothetical protein
LKYVLGDDLNKKSQIDGANGQSRRLMKAKADRNEISISSYFPQFHKECMEMASSVDGRDQK